MSTAPKPQGQNQTSVKPLPRLFRIRFIHAVRKGCTALEVAGQFRIAVWKAREHAVKLGLTFTDGRRTTQRLAFGIKQEDLEELGADETVSSL